MADRVRDEVLEHDPQHSWAQRHDELGVDVQDERDVGTGGRLRELRDHLVRDRPYGRRAERDRLPAGLQLGEEEHVVDQLADLLHLLPCPLDQRLRVLALQGGGLEQGERAERAASGARAIRRR